MVSVVIASMILMAGPRTAAKQPAWLDFMLAGYAFAYDDKHGPVGVYDRRQRLFLIRTIECDGGSLMLTLTRDRNLVANEGFVVPHFNEGQSGDGSELELKPLVDVSTGKGLHLGDSPDHVESKLGKPTRKERSGSRDQFLNYVYSWQAGKRDDDNVYTETYRFKEGKLIEIVFDREANEL